MIERFLAQAPPFAGYEDLRERLAPRASAGFHYAYDVLDVLAAERPEARALLIVGPQGEAQAFTFAQVSQASHRLASALSGAGVGRGDTALVLMGDDPLYWPLMMALHRLGTPAAPVSAQMSAGDLAYCLQKTGATVVFAAGEALREKVEAAGYSGLAFATGGEGGLWRSLEVLAEAGDGDFPRPELAADQPMLMYFTSGSTGLPKLAAHDFRYPLGLIAAGFWQGLKEGGLHLTIADNGWSKSSWGKLYTPWLFGAAMMVYADENPEPAALVAALGQYGVDSFCAAPQVYRSLVSVDFTPQELPALQRATFMAEPLHPEVFELFRERSGLAPAGGFGQSENNLLLAQFPGMPEIPGCMGRPSPLFDLDVVDASGASCAPGVSGELVVRLPAQRPLGFFLGYVGEEAPAPGLFRTGDIVWRDEWGNYFFVGRGDDVIHCAGYRIGPYEVEEVLLRHPAVGEVAVFGMPDPLRHQVVKASIVLSEGYAPSDALKKELQAHVRGATAPYKCPRVVEFVAELPHSAGGKLRRGALRDGE